MDRGRGGRGSNQHRGASHARGQNRGPRGGGAPHPPRADQDPDTNSIVPENRDVDIGYIDTHCHVEYIMQKLKLSSFDKFFQRQKVPANFAGCISIFCDPAALSPSFGLWTELVEHSQIWAAFGIHPHNAKYYNDSTEQRIKECMKHPKAVAWGECGLDYAKNLSDQDVQRDAFRRQVLCAVELNKPLIVHSRDAADDTFQILSDLMPKDHPVHVHCFTDGPEEATRLLAEFSNLYIGFTGVLTYSTANKIVATAKAVPLNRTLVETDGPYMPPEPIARGRISHSGHIPIIIKKLAEIHNVDYIAALAQIRENTREVYKI